VNRSPKSGISFDSDFLDLSDFSEIWAETEAIGVVRRIMDNVEARIILFIISELHGFGMIKI